MRFSTYHVHIGSNMVDTDQCPASNTVTTNTQRMGIPKCTGEGNREINDCIIPGSEVDVVDISYTRSKCTKTKLDAMHLRTGRNSVKLHLHLHIRILWNSAAAV